MALTLKAIASPLTSEGKSGPPSLVRKEDGLGPVWMSGLVPPKPWRRRMGHSHACQNPQPHAKAAFTNGQLSLYE